jgi:hypothetical protein
MSEEYKPECTFTPDENSSVCVKCGDLVYCLNADPRNEPKSDKAEKV